MYQLDKKIIREINRGGCARRLLIYVLVCLGIVFLVCLLVNLISG